MQPSAFKEGHTSSTAELKRFSIVPTASTEEVQLGYFVEEEDQYKLVFTNLNLESGNSTVQDSFEAPEDKFEELVVYSPLVKSKF